MGRKTLTHSSPRFRPISFAKHRIVSAANVLTWEKVRSFETELALSIAIVIALLPTHMCIWLFMRITNFLLHSSLVSRWFEVLRHWEEGDQHFSLADVWLWRIKRTKNVTQLSKFLTQWHALRKHRVYNLDGTGSATAGMPGGFMRTH